MALPRPTRIVRGLALAALLALVAPSSAGANWPAVPPALPAPTGHVVSVSTEAALQAAVAGVTSDTTIVIAPGIYTLSSTLVFQGTLSNVTIRGATNNRDDVVLRGPGMTVDSASTPYGIWTGGNVQGITIANMTIRDFFYHPIIFNGGTQTPRVYNVHLINAGEQFVKSNPDTQGGGVNNGVVEYSLIEYETTSKDDYTNGVDVLTGKNWIIRNNLFRNIRAPSGLLAGPAVLMWNGTQNTLTEGNTFIDCQREIAYGLIERTPHDNTGGVVRNNVIYRDSTVTDGDVAIGVYDSPNTRVVNNTVFITGSYPNAIEYRFTGTTGAYIANNLVNKAISARDGATASVTNNLTTATAALFVDPANGDLHLKSTATAAIDKALALSDVTVDWDGDARPSGSAPDLGADEFVPYPTPRPPTSVVIKVSRAAESHGQPASSSLRLPTRPV